MNDKLSYDSMKVRINGVPTQYYNRFSRGPGMPVSCYTLSVDGDEYLQLKPSGWVVIRVSTLTETPVEVQS